MTRTLSDTQLGFASVSRRFDAEIFIAREGHCNESSLHGEIAPWVCVRVPRALIEGTMGFSFVDRILEIEPGRRARGIYRMPGLWRCVPPWLAAEAIGQLAAWV